MPESTQKRKTPWERRLENKIAALRKDIGQVAENVKDITSKRFKTRISIIMRKNEKEGEDTEPHEMLNKVKQKLLALAARLRRYHASC